MTLTRNCCLFVFVLLLAACGGTPPKSVSQPTENKPQIISDDKPTLTQLLESAAQKDNPYPELVEITKQLAESNCAKSLRIAQLLKESNIPEELQNQLNFVGGGCLLQLLQPTEAEQWLKQLPDDQNWLHQKHQLLYSVYEQQSRWWLAANSYYYTAEPSPETELIIWELLARIPTTELRERATDISNIQHLVQLMTIQRQFTHDFESASDALQQWLIDNPTHPFQETLPESLNFAISDSLIRGNNIAVLLPLSGPRQAQGEAVKEGILAASFSQNIEDRNYTFIDTHLWSTGELPSFTDFDLVIGPLLKQSIDLIRPQLPENLPVLNLNRSDIDDSRNNHFYLSLAPEDEARQMAESLLQQGFVSPFVISHNNSVYQRMKNTFIASWTEQYGSTPQVLDFSETKEIRKGVNDTLSLTASKGRINQIRNMLKPQLHAMERNRRDIDVIIIFANTTHTELINPLIEASISPFAEIIPVFASSRSHSRYHSKNDLRDLRNLQFLDMPWMLPSREYNWLQNFSQKLWPDRRDNLNRLFAMGYDAINILPYLKLLQTLPNQTWKGLTGEIAVDTSGQTNRLSRWAQFTEERVVALEHH